MYSDTSTNEDFTLFSGLDNITFHLVKIAQPRFILIGQEIVLRLYNSGAIILVSHEIIEMNNICLSFYFNLFILKLNNNNNVLFVVCGKER